MVDFVVITVFSLDLLVLGYANDGRKGTAVMDPWGRGCGNVGPP